LENPDVLIQTEQADMIKGNNMVIDDPRPEEDAKSTPSRKVVIEKLPDGEETITITIRGSTTGNHERKAEGSNLAHDNGKRKRPPLTKSRRSDSHGRPDRVTEPWSDHSQNWSDHV
jgi:hypothetical protein